MLHSELCIILGFLIKTLCISKENAWMKTKFKHVDIFTFTKQTYNLNKEEVSS